jgi:hypothetical protein
MTRISVSAEPEAPEMVVDTVACPECSHTAEVQWRTTLPSTSGPVEHLKIRCVGGHCFFLPASYVTQ